MNTLFLEHFDDMIATAVDVEQLNHAILQLAVRGKLVLQNSTDVPAISLLKQLDENYQEMLHSQGEDIPEGWSLCTFSNLADVLRGVSYEKSQAQKTPENGLLPILRANNIGDGLNFDDLVYVPVHFVSDEQRLLEQDIVVCMSSGSPTLVGKSAMLRQPFDGSFGAFCAVLRSKTNVTAEYLNLYLQSPQCRELFTKTGRGIGINNLRVSDLLNSPLYLPPLAEQQRIVARVEELFAQTRALAKELGRSQIELDGLNKSAL
jgi:type I restriction enzyme, S subunit